MRFFDRIRSLLVGRAFGTQISTDNTMGPNSNLRDPDDPAYQQTHDALQSYWEKVGQVDPIVISYIVNPMFLGSPPWPGGKQVFRIIRAAESLIIASDGLSAPFDEDKNILQNGFQMEVFIEIKGQQAMELDDIKSSAAFALIEEASRQVADWGGITEVLEEFGLASSEIPVSSDSIPERFLTSDGRVGVIFGMSAEGRPKIVPNTPLSPVRMVPVTVLLPSEVQKAAEGTEQRDRITKRLIDAGYQHFSCFERDGVV